MLLFLIGVDLPTILVIFVLLFLFGWLIFRLSKGLFRRIMKGASDNKINFLSRICAFILSPTLIIGGMALYIYISIQFVPGESEEEIVSQHYQMMEEGIAEDLKIGMSKAAVVSILGENDTTKSVMTYDLSLPEATEKYFLDLKFDKGKLTSFQRQQ